LFIETHPKPDEALSDGPNMIPLGEMAATLRTLLKVFKAVN
jgi:2-dehydro-3-deoxyphosphooctonate aldolase (KDO 8-P synthase)